MLHFAYGSNMCRAAMGRRCSTAVAIGHAELRNWRVGVMAAGYLTVTPQQGALVRGVLWRLSPSDVAALNAYESVDAGLYRRRVLPVVCKGRTVPALVYVGPAAPAQPHPGYFAGVIAAAKAWDLPASYLRELARLAVTPRRADLRRSA